MNDLGMLDSIGIQVAKATLTKRNIIVRLRDIAIGTMDIAPPTSPVANQLVRWNLRTAETRCRHWNRF